MGTGGKCGKSERNQQIRHENAEYRAKSAQQLNIWHGGPNSVLHNMLSFRVLHQSHAFRAEAAEKVLL